MLQDFTSATLDEQVAICEGTVPNLLGVRHECPARLQCLQDFVQTTLDVTGMNDAYDNQIVRGGLKPQQLLKLCQRARKLRIEGHEHGHELREAVGG